jgi:hypothetical protein
MLIKMGIKKASKIIFVLTVAGNLEIAIKATVATNKKLNMNA